MMNKKLKSAVVEAIGFSPTYNILKASSEFAACGLCSFSDAEDIAHNLVAYCLEIIAKKPELKTANLSTYLDKCIKTEVIRLRDQLIETRKLFQFENQCSPSFDDEEDDEPNTIESFADPNALNGYDYCELKELQEIITSLTERDRLIVLEILQGEPPYLAAEHHGRTRNYCSRQLFPLLRKKVCTKIGDFYSK